MDVIRTVLNDNVGKLLLRLTVAGLMLFHGLGKWNTLHDKQGAVEMIGKNLTDAGMPEFVKYGVIIGELIAPIFILVGFFTRPAALVMAINMVVAVCMAHKAMLFTVDEQGSYALELQAFYFFGALAIVFLGAGKISLDALFFHRTAATPPPATPKVETQNRATK